MKPLGLSDSQYGAVVSACEPLAPSDRSRFLVELAALLRSSEPGELGDGQVARAIRHAIRPFFRPPTIGEQPRHNSKVGEPIA